MSEPKLTRYNSDWKENKNGDWYYYEDVETIINNRDKEIEILKAGVNLNGSFASDRMERIKEQADEIERLKKGLGGIIAYDKDLSNRGQWSACYDDVVTLAEQALATQPQKGVSE